MKLGVTSFVLGILFGALSWSAESTPRKLSCDIFVGKTFKDREGFYSLPFTAEIPEVGQTNKYYFDTSSGGTVQISSAEFQRRWPEEAVHMIEVVLAQSPDKMIVQDITFYGVYDPNHPEKGVPSYLAKSSAPLVDVVTRTYVDSQSLEEVFIGTFVNTQVVAPEVHGFVSCEEILYTKAPGQ